MCAMVMDFAASNPTNLFEKIVAIVLCICMGCVYGYMIGATSRVSSARSCPLGPFDRYSPSVIRGALRTTR